MTNLYLPPYCQSAIIEQTKSQNQSHPKDLTPYTVELGNITFKLAKHFGFCFGVKNALSLAYKIIAENPTRQIYLLSEIIHNPVVNNDLTKRGIKFLMDSKGNTLIPFETLNKNDIVIIPAFGITLELLQQFKDLGIDIEQYDTTCPFVQKVWKTAKKLGQAGDTIIIHGSPTHEETKATFSHISALTPTLVIKNKQDALKLADFITGNADIKEFKNYLKDYSKNFDPKKDLKRIGLVQQTTMLAHETEEIYEILKQALTTNDVIHTTGDTKHFADTKHTLCYATQQNQQATEFLCATSNADLALIVGGYNSSNTKHLVEIAQKYLPTFFIKDSDDILNSAQIRNFDIQTGIIKETSNWIPAKDKLTIAISAGASCPDKVIEEVMTKIKLYSFSHTTTSP
jgi:4-hydroxy-3-methylbut-2-enyl diphosphate reductase